MQTELQETQWFPVDLGHQQVNVRKWKAKDRKAFKQSLKTEEDISKNILNTLINPCVKEKCALGFTEVQYLFVKIRELSLGNDITFKYTCSCGKKNAEAVKISDVNTFSFKPWAPIKTANHIIEIGNVPNIDFYNKKIFDENYDSLWEIAFRVKSLDGDIAKGFDEIVEFLENLDIDECDEIMEQYHQMAFTINNVKGFTCSCGKVNNFEFDEIPEFFPKSWVDV